MNDEKTLDISWTTILKIAFAALLFYLIYQIRDVLILIIFAIILSLLLNPVINFLERKKVPRTFATISVYLIVFGLISLFFYLTIDFLIQETQKLVKIFPQYFDKISPPLRGLGIQTFGNLEELINTFGKTLEKTAANVFNVLFVIFGGIFSTLFVLTLAIFLSLEQKIFEKTLTLFFPKKYETYVLELWENSQRKVSGWFGARIIACLFVGLLSYFALFLFNANYSFLLAVVAGVFNFIPFIGPILTGVLIFLIISFDSISKAILALVAFTLIQQVENNILTPILTRKFIGLSPALVLVSLAIGGKLAGILGATLAVPLAGILFEFLRDFLAKRRGETL
ncbi:AI-2E family transporter [Patescibacteria group bacterium]|nr:AI-2E family transporter [Patescibacteria group bacterium]MBU4480751.1 AI-2E family transporter [Patescibacteria group bacterium]